MNSLYDQLLALQQIPNAYTEWTEYRAGLTAFIISHADHNLSALIVGAGACNDFNLSKLIEHFSQITLLDRNEASMHAGIESQGISTDRIRIVQLICWVFPMLRTERWTPYYWRKSAINYDSKLMRRTVSSSSFFRRCKMLSNIENHMILVKRVSMRTM